MTTLTIPHERALTLLFAELESAAEEQAEAFLGTPGSLAERTNAAGVRFWVHRYLDATGRRHEVYLGKSSDAATTDLVATLPLSLVPVGHLAERTRPESAWRRYGVRSRARAFCRAQAHRVATAYESRRQTRKGPHAGGDLDGSRHRTLSGCIGGCISRGTSKRCEAHRAGNKGARTSLTRRCRRRLGCAALEKATSLTSLESELIGYLSAADRDFTSVQSLFSARRVRYRSGPSRLAASSACFRFCSAAASANSAFIALNRWARKRSSEA